ncbi:MAG: hypothetical protein ACR2NZ_13285 [Rubripirellula sp.]
MPRIPKTRRVLLAVLVMFAAAGQLAISNTAEAGWCGNCLDQTGCSCCCPACDHVCHLDTELVDEDISCFEVESKVICIPRVVFPWQRKKCHSCDSCDGRGCTNCVNNGARTRRICVLKTDKYQCPKCKYTWTAKPTGCCDGCDSGCDRCEGGCVKTEAKSENETKVVSTEPELLPTWKTAAKPPVYIKSTSNSLESVTVEPSRKWSSFNR